MELAETIAGWFSSAFKWVGNSFSTNLDFQLTPRAEAVEEAQANVRKVKKKQKYVVVLGYVRTGKSSLCRALGKRVNRPENSGNFVVDECFEFYEIEDHDVTLIDTPGIGDDPIADFETLENVNKLVKTIGPISTFILTIHGQHPRLGERHQQAMRWMTSSLGRRYLKSTVVFFNFWAWDDRAVATRKRSGESEEGKTASINNYFHKSFNVKHDVPVMFLDNRPDLSDVRQREKLQAVRDGLGRLSVSTPGYSPYD